MKRNTLIVALSIALLLGGCAALLPIAKWLAIPIATKLIEGSNDKNEDESNDESDQDETLELIELGDES